MNAEQTRPAYEPQEPESAPGLPLFEAAGVEIPPFVEELTQGQPLGPAMKKLYVSMQKRQARAEPEEKPEPLPLVDEEELAKIADPQEREERRREKIRMYKEHPDALRHYTAISEKIKAERNKPIMLEPWANNKRAAPNAVFRSALFPALNNQQSRRYVENQKVYSISGLEVRFTGKQFDQTDLDVYLEILHLAKDTPLGKPVRFSAHSLLKALGWATGGKDHKRLHSHLIRLCGGVIDANDHTARYFGQLIFGGIRDEITHDYEITINPNFAKLFGFGLWSAIDLEQRRALERNSTAKSLHAYYSTHAAPGLHRYDTLASIAGLEGKNKTAVRNSLIRAHEELKRIGFLVSYDAKPNGIEVVINMTEGQQQHVIRKITKQPRSKAGHGNPNHQDPEGR